MSGTLLVYDSAFPRSANILSTPSTAELNANNYPTPIQTHAIIPSSAVSSIGGDVAFYADLMGSLDVLIIFGHGIVVNGVTHGILISHDNLTTSNLWALAPVRGKIARGGRIELWVCAAASGTSSASGTSGQQFCQLMADHTGVRVVAAENTQAFSTVSQENVSGTDFWLTKTSFLPWEGPVRTFRPRR